MKKKPSDTSLRKDVADCENCMYFDYSDDEDSAKECQLSLDEDDYVKALSDQSRTCPYFRFWDEYKFVKKQN